MNRIAITIVMLVSSTAFADESLRATAGTPQPQHDISIQLATLDETGISIHGERDLGRRKLSAVIGVGVRSAASGDYDSFTFGVGAELRRWLRRNTTMKGWYVSARTDLARTSLEDTVEMREIGALVSWSIGAGLGYRWNIYRGLEVTPSIGLSMIIEGGMDGRSPVTARGAGTVGLALGWMF